MDEGSLTLAFAPGDGSLVSLRAPDAPALLGWVRALAAQDLRVRWAFREGAAGRVVRGRAYIEEVAVPGAAPPDDAPAPPEPSEAGEWTP